MPMAMPSEKIKYCIYCNSCGWCQHISELSHYAAKPCPQCGRNTYFEVISAPKPKYSAVHPYPPKDLSNGSR